MAQGRLDVQRAFFDLADPDGAKRRGAVNLLIDALDGTHREVFDEFLATLDDRPAEARVAFEDVVACRDDLVSWLLDVLLEGAFGRDAARGILVGHAVRAIRERDGSREPMALASTLDVTPWAFERIDLRELLRDVRHLAAPRVPFLLDPDVDEALPVEPELEILRMHPAPIAWILGTAERHQLVLERVEGLVFLHQDTPRDDLELPALLDVWLARAARSPFDAERVVEAVTALQIPGWHRAVERVVATSHERSSAWGRALVRGGAPHTAQHVTREALSVLLHLPAWSPQGERHILRYLVQRLFQAPGRDAHLAALEAEGQAAIPLVRDRLQRLTAWFDPAGRADDLRAWMRSGDPDRAVFAWRLLLRADALIDQDLADGCARASAYDARIRALWMERNVEDRPLAEEDRRALLARLMERPTGAGGALDPWNVVLGVRSADVSIVRATLEAVLRSEDAEAMEILLESAAPYLRRSESGRRVLRETFRSWAGGVLEEPARFLRVRALGERLGFSITTFGISEISEWPPWRPRLLDADPYEGGFWEGA